MNPTQLPRSPSQGWIFRVALFAAGAWLAAYIPFKYATQLHAIGGLYAFAFPLSAILALAGMIFAWKPKTACDCGTPVRAGIAAISVLWLVTGMACVNSLALAIAERPLHGTFATMQMVVQHVFLSLGLLAFVFSPLRMARALGVAPPPAPATGHTTGNAAAAARAPV